MHTHWNSILCYFRKNIYKMFLIISCNYNYSPSKYVEIFIYMHLFIVKTEIILSSIPEKNRNKFNNSWKAKVTHNHLNAEYFTWLTYFLQLIRRPFQITLREDFPHIRPKKNLQNNALTDCNDLLIEILSRLIKYFSLQIFPQPFERFWRTIYVTMETLVPKRARVLTLDPPQWALYGKIFASLNLLPCEFRVYIFWNLIALKSIRRESLKGRWPLQVANKFVKSSVLFLKLLECISEPPPPRWYFKALNKTHCFMKRFILGSFWTKWSIICGY